MEEICKRKSLGTDSNDFHDELLDPRIQAELEKLNSTTETINSLEQQLEKARAAFRQHLTDSTQQLNDMMKKLGTSVEKARPYYEARIKAKEAQLETQSAAQRFERACSQLTAAKEMVYLAEQGFFCKGQPFDPAWQEMLNHATMKVNDAERERLESEVEHKRTAYFFNEAEKHVQYLQKELRRAISKSRPYFESKATFIQQMEEQKQHVSCLEETVKAAKQTYANTLKSLEAISDSVHQQRQEAKLRQEMGTRESGVGAETPEPPPSHEEKTEVVLDTGQETNVSEVVENRCAKHIETNSISRSHSKEAEPSQTEVKVNTKDREPKVSRISTAEGGRVMPRSESYSKVEGNNRSQEWNNSQTVVKRRFHTRASVPAVKVMTSGTEPESENELGLATELTRRSNAEIMESLQRAKGARSPRSLLIPRRRSQDDLLDDASDNESQSGSLASASMLDDDQIQSLMLECSTGDYAKFIARMDSKESERYKRMSLPIKLSYLENYMSFKPIWDDSQTDGGSSEQSGENGREMEVEQSAVSGVDFLRANIQGTESNMDAEQKIVSSVDSHESQAVTEVSSQSTKDVPSQENHIATVETMEVEISEEVTYL